MKLPVRLVLAACLIGSGAANAAGNEPATLASIRDTALKSDWAYERLADMTDLIGPRLSGSPGAAAAVNQVADAMRKLGATVTLQPTKVPHWVRGEEKAELIEYAGRPNGVTQKIVLTALGGSGATPDAGLKAPLMVVNSMDELAARAQEVKGRIVLIDVPFDQTMADNGHAGHAYGRGSAVRFTGPPKAASLGAAAVLVRSIGGANFRLPHTGVTGLVDGARIPAAAVTVEDALLIKRLMARGPVSMHLTLTPKMLPDADSFNVIADFPGTDKADEFVLVTGHLDSWDLATGAHDDGGGVVAAMSVIETLKKLNLKPRRTIRVIAWMNEENGGKGSDTYEAAYKGKMDKQFAAIESDNGAARALGVTTSVPAAHFKLLQPLQAALAQMDAGVMRRQDSLPTGDLSGLEEQGVPVFTPLVDTSTYFHYHHTPADTLDKVNPENLRRLAALMGTLTWYLANMDQPIGRVAAPVK